LLPNFKSKKISQQPKFPAFVKQQSKINAFMGTTTKLVQQPPNLVEFSADTRIFEITH
jgi:hypothetical protein